MKHIGVIGMGRVGLTLALTLANSGFKILGIENDDTIVKSLNNGIPHFYENGMEALLKKHLREGNLRVRNKIDESQDVYIIAVGTPVDKKSKMIILEHLIHATVEVTKQLKEGDFVILRSTAPIGTSRNVILPLLRASKKTIHLAFCPERTIEGRALKELKELPQIVGGLDEISTDMAVSIFSKVTPTIVRAQSLEAAEFVKLIDNTYRDLHFAYANEIVLLAQRYKIDGYRLIKAANLGYSRNNIPLPGFVGGACLSKDPYILIKSASEKDLLIKLPEVSREINENLIDTVAQKLENELSSLGKSLKEAKIFILGIAFKGEPENDDTRDSPAVLMADYLKQNYSCKEIFGHDFVVPQREIAKVGMKPCSLEEGFINADVVLLLNSHHSYSELDTNKLFNTMRKPAIFFDGWNIFSPEEISKTNSIIYTGLGNG
jgi:UDP-N-acetyl-D-mannosaminuronic acid dehydrogenase